MSNWGGEGVPENGQKLLNAFGNESIFIGVNRVGDWISEHPATGTICKTFSYDCKPIKSHEEAEREVASPQIASRPHKSTVVVAKRFGTRRSKQIKRTINRFVNKCRREI